MMNEKFTTSIEYALETQDMEMFNFLLRNFTALKKKQREKILTTTVLNARHTDFIKRVIELGGDINYKDEDKNTLLHYAATTARPETVSFFIEQGLDLEAKNNYEFTPLCIAAKESESVAVLKTLIAAGADKDVRSGHGETLLITAAGMNPNPKITEFLLHSGFDTEDCDDYGYTAFLNAARWQSNSDILALLINANADIYAKTDSGDTAFHLAALNDNVETAYYISAQFKTSETKNNDISCFEEALINASSQKVFTIYFRKMREEHVMHACMNENPEILETLILAGYDANTADTNGMTALMMAARFNTNPDIINMLLYYHGIWNNRDDNGRTALHYAAANTDTTIYEWMLGHEKFKTLASTTDESGNTPEYYRSHQDEF